MGGVFFIWLLVCSVHLDSLVVVDYCTNISMNTLGSGVISKVDFE